MSEKKWFLVFLLFLLIIVPLIFMKTVNAGEDGYSPNDSKILENRDKEGDQNNDALMPAGDVKRYRDSGVIIKVKRMPDENGQKTFEVTAENQNAVKRTLSGRICLFDLRIKQAECGSGECAVYMELPPKSKEIKKWNCKEKSFFSAWTFVIVRIY